ncbi:MAG: hypothetical protein NTU44_06070 [Bacteroidetes bacterium]|nr:hypothetical protein [Bacteroidota bacterium]
MTLKKIFLTLLGFIFTLLAYPQTHTLDGFKSIGKNSISPILEGKEVKGYVLYFKSDKADSKNDNYGLQLFDENLTKVKEIWMKKPRNQFFLVNNCYNGEAFGFYYYNMKEEVFEIISYDRGLEQLGTTTIEEVSKMDISMVKQSLASGEDNDGSSYSLNLYPVPNKGFLRNGILGTTRGYTLDMYDNDLKPLWHFETEKKSKEYETLIIYDVNAKYITACCARRSSMMSKRMTFYMVVFDVENGTKIIDQELGENDDYELSMTGLSYDEERNEFMVIGDFFNADDKPGVNKSLGFYVKRYSPDGKETAQNFYAWNKEVAKVLPPEAKRSLNEGYMNFTHKVVKGPDGRIYIITEQYRTGTDAGGIALNILGGGYGNSMTKAVVGNILIFVLNPDLKIAEAFFVAKDPSNVTLPPGADFYGKGLIGIMTEFLGGFDYQFTQTSNDGKTFNIVYINYDKEKHEKTKKILGNILLTKDGKLKTDKIDVSGKSTSSYIYPGKPGYLMMVDFLKKQKQLGLKLVKLNE